MRAKEDVLADMLKLTTELLYDAEKNLIWDSLIGEGTKLLDVGCGDGSYLNRIRKSFPEAELTGVEVNEYLFRRAMQSSGGKISYICGSYDSIPKGQMYDIVLMRLVVHHLSDKQHLANWLKSVTHSRSVVLIIDIDEDSLHWNPLLPLFSDLYLQFRRMLPKSRLLDVKDALKLEFEHEGLVYRSCTTYLVGGIEPSIKRRMHAYMLLVAEFLLGPSVPADYVNELQVWLDDPAGTHSFHMFSMSLQKSEANSLHPEVYHGVV
jgi:ubiquinone/menaquinone biosynthesis C-methylase UbiE